MGEKSGLKEKEKTEGRGNWKRKQRPLQVCRCIRARSSRKESTKIQKAERSCHSVIFPLTKIGRQRKDKKSSVGGADWKRTKSRKNRPTALQPDSINTETGRGVAVLRSIEPAMEDDSRRKGRVGR